MEKMCLQCKRSLPKSQFPKNKNRSDGLNATCRDCVSEYSRAYYQRNKDRIKARTSAWQRANPDKANKARLKYVYGIASGQYEEMHEAQGGVCAVCGNPETVNGGERLAVDHNHVTGQVRGLLCRKCNTALGLLQEDRDRIQRLVTYLDTYDKAAKTCPCAA